MNIFYLDSDPVASARFMCDKHIVKMPLESAQMLSTAHRLLDGQNTTVSDSEKRVEPKKLWLLDGESAHVESFLDKSGSTKHRWVIDNAICYKAAHAKHPSTVWTMSSSANYKWHVLFFEAMLAEYTFRYGKKHKSSALLDFFKQAPKNIEYGDFTQPTPAMPDRYKTMDSITAYRRYYAGDKWKFAKWKHNELPSWFASYMSATWNDEARLERLGTLYKIAQRKAQGKTIPTDNRVYSLALQLSNASKNQELVQEAN